MCPSPLHRVTTFATTPLTLAFYPAWYRTKTERERRGLPGVPPPRDSSGGGSGFGEEAVRSRFAVVVEQFEHLPAIMSFLRLLVPPSPPPSISKLSSPSPPPSSPSPSNEKESDPNALQQQQQQQQQPELAFLRLVENTDRTSALLRAAESETALLRADTLAAVLKAFASGLGARIRHFALNIAAPDAYPQQVAEFVEVHDSQVAVVPWLLPASATATATATGPTDAADGAMTAPASAATTESGAPGVAESWLPNPFEGLFTGARSISAHGAAEYATYVRHLFAESPSDVAVFLERAQTDSAIMTAGRAHLFLAFHGGSDDRFALAMVDQLVKNHPYLTASVVRITRSGEPTEHDHAIVDGDNIKKATTRDSTATTTQSDEPLFTLTRGGGGATNGDTIYPSIMGGGRGLQSETEDDVLWSRLVAASKASSSSTNPPRIEFSTASSHRPLRLALARLAAVRSQCVTKSVPVVVFAGRGRRDAPSHTTEALALLKERNALVAQSVVVSSEVRRALGDVASVYVLEGEKGTGDRIVVLQKGGKRGRVPGRSTVIVEEDESADNPKAA